MVNYTDIDIDFADRDQILKLIRHTPAMQLKKGQEVKHNTGVYVSDIPANTFTGLSAIDYKTAEQRGYFKLDFLNVGVYDLINNQQHYDDLMRQDCPWHRLKEQEFVQKIIHISNHWHIIKNMTVDSVPRMAMFLALIRPGKRHLVGKDWKEISADIWTKTDEYTFKKAHAVSYAVLVSLHMKLIHEQD